MTQAEIHADFMRAVWRDEIRTPDESESLYDKYVDACEVASTMGGKPTGPEDPDNENMAEWLFPDGSSAKIGKSSIA